MDNEVVRVLKATAEIYGKNLSEAAAVMFLVDLQEYSPRQITEALSRCRKELTTFPTIAQVIGRIPDGRPGVEEAWAMLPKSEDDSVVWTEEMAEAYGSVAQLLASDPVAARMAFKEIYPKLIQTARDEKQSVRWVASLGHDPSHREAVLKEAVRKNRLTQAHANSLLPHDSQPIAGEIKNLLPFAK